jgi:hypothetical protein
VRWRGGKGRRAVWFHVGHVVSSGAADDRRHMMKRPRCTMHRVLQASMSGPPTGGGAIFDRGACALVRSRATQRGFPNKLWPHQLFIPRSSTILGGSLSRGDSCGGLELQVSSAHPSRWCSSDPEWHGCPHTDGGHR